jgi:hypothetical protein
MMMMGHSMLTMMTILMRIDHHRLEVQILGNLSTIEEDEPSYLQVIVFLEI